MWSEMLKARIRRRKLTEQPLVTQVVLATEATSGLSQSSLGMFTVLHVEWNKVFLQDSC